MNDGRASPDSDGYSGFLDDIPEKDLFGIGDDNEFRPSTSTSLGKRRLDEPLGEARLVKQPPASNNESQESEAPARTIVPQTFDNDGSPFIIAAHRFWDPYIEKLSEGVQFEIARLVTAGILSMDEIEIAAVNKLSGSNAINAPKVASVLKSGNRQKTSTVFPKELAARSPWVELDLEKENLDTDFLGGLGFGKEKEWYAGKVEFRGKLMEIKKDTKKGSVETPDYHIRLEPPSLGHSSRFTRRWGSTRFLRIKVSKQIIGRKNNGLMTLFRRPFLLNKSVFRAFYSKENTVFLVKTNEYYDFHQRLVLSGGLYDADRGPLPLIEFLNWHNALHLNSKQTMAKWSARFALGLSNSAPGVLLKEDNFFHEPEIVSAEGSEMTDGCGYINKVGLVSIRNKFAWSDIPVAIQVRVVGAKGLLLLHPGQDENDREQPTVWLRPSQIKITYAHDQVADPAILCIDVLRTSHLRSPSRLSTETLTNLGENGVSTQVFVDLMQTGLQQLVEGFLKWEGRDAMYDLWCAVSRAGSVMTSRLAREAVGEARVRGYYERDPEEDDEDEDGLDAEAALRERSSAWWWDQVSGCPSSLEETVMVLLDSGFTPQTCAVLRDKLKAIVSKSIKNYTNRYRIEVPMSCTAFVVPDPTGLLKEGEIFIKASKRKLIGPDGNNTDIIMGNVLLTRHPCKLPTDVQKFKAVDVPELRNYVDVIVCSVKGSRRLIDLCAGGDYDGDKGLAIWQPEIVNQFLPPDLKYSVEPKCVATCFSKRNENVEDFVRRIEHIAVPQKMREIQWYLLGAIREQPVVGRYSEFHDLATYTLGYDAPETIRLAYMFCKVLDGAKTGLTVLPEVLAEDQKKYNGRPPLWKEIKDEKDRPKLMLIHRESNCLPAKRGRTLGEFIMDELQKAAKAESNSQHRRIDVTFDRQNDESDKDLIAPWREAERLASRRFTLKKDDWMRQDLDKIRKHVHDIFDKYKGGIHMRQSPIKNSTASSFNGAAFTELPIEERQDRIRALSREFVGGPPAGELFLLPTEVARFRASYAYLYDSQQMSRGWSRFPWDVAMRELCSIKANALGYSKTSASDFYERFTMKSTSR